MLDVSASTRGALKADIVSILTLQPRRRSVAMVLMSRLHSQGWGRLWANFEQFTLLCKRLHLFRYRAKGRAGQIVEFIALDAKPEAEPDYFAASGFVITAADGHWVNRGNPAKTTTLNSMARIWKTRRGVVGYCRNNGHDLDGIKATKEIQIDGLTSVAY